MSLGTLGCAAPHELVRDSGSDSDSGAPWLDVAPPEPAAGALATVAAPPSLSAPPPRASGQHQAGMRWKPSVGPGQW